MPYTPRCLEHVNYYRGVVAAQGKRIAELTAMIASSDGDDKHMNELQNVFRDLTFSIEQLSKMTQRAKRIQGQFNQLLTVGNVVAVGPLEQGRGRGKR